MTKLRAFTLAEILITLGIIGVVAALTIPAVIEKYQKKVTATKLKQTYSILYQAIKMSEIDNGPVTEWNSGGNQTYLYPYLKIVKVCTSNSYECTADWSLHYQTWFILSNGVHIAVSGYSNTNVTTIYIDLNGKSKPNVKGKDMFTMAIVKSPSTIAYWYGSFRGKKAGLYFYGNGWDRETLKSECKGTRFDACGELIMRDGWEIKDDYPW
jgi:prepilin-type N-terminal cleavage/methylation domain-containing protein